MESSSAYMGIITPRSRRLRTIGVVLLIAIGLMVLYGYFGLMPSFAPSDTQLNPAKTPTIHAPAGDTAISQAHLPSHAERVRKLRVTAALAYWGVCGLLLVGVLFVAWLDLREISRQYVEERRAMWMQAASRHEMPDDSS